MYATVAVLLFCFTALSAAHDDHHDSHTSLRSSNRQLQYAHEPLRCDTREPDERDHAARARADAFARFRTERKEGVFAETATSYTISVCFHNPRWFNPLANYVKDRFITNEELQAQLEHLNKAFTVSSCCDTANSWCTAGSCSVDTSIQFVLAKLTKKNITGTVASTSDEGACVKRRRVHHNRMSMTRLNDERKKRRWRLGDESVLNIYFVRAFSESSQDVTGYSTYPWDYDSNPARDGVVVSPDYVKGSTKNSRFTEGDTLVHEVG